MATRENGGHDSSVEALFKQYGEYASALRNWFVVYGVGGIALFFTEPAAFERFATSTKLTIIIAFLVTVIAQVVLAFTNKWIHWCNYRGAESAAFRATKLYALAGKLAHSVWLDFTLDLVSLVSALIATGVLIHALAVSPSGVSAPGAANVTSLVGILLPRGQWVGALHRIFPAA